MKKTIVLGLTAAVVVTAAYASTSYIEHISSGSGQIGIYIESKGSNAKPEWEADKSLFVEGNQKSKPTTLIRNTDTAGKALRVEAKFGGAISAESKGIVLDVKHQNKNQTAIRSNGAIQIVTRTTDRKETGTWTIQPVDNGGLKFVAPNGTVALQFNNKGEIITLNQPQ